MKITKAVIPAAGLGTRMLPISKAVPKEMLPIVDKPAISYLVKEAVDSGIQDILIITAFGKEAMADYFDYSPIYDHHLEKKGQHEAAQTLRSLADMANIYFLRQKEAKGLGHAVLTAKSFVGNDDFVVMYGDDVIISEKPVVRQLMDVYEKYGLGVAGVKEVPWELVMKYCSLDASLLEDHVYHVKNMIEKPKTREEAFTNLSILGRVILPASIFDILEQTGPGAGGEIQLTDAMKELCLREGMCALDFEGTRYDMGSKLGFLMANVKEGVKNEEIGAPFKTFLKEFIKEL
ncbi:MAG: UTP--glucose-1-phosphate uridylyltransferase [Clostridiales bacterium]|nr:UTP--glucose-1-phosphate uridylyltransferase [Clostridiales bacterium]